MVVEGIWQLLKIVVVVVELQRVVDIVVVSIGALVAERDVLYGLLLISKNIVSAIAYVGVLVRH